MRDYVKEINAYDVKIPAKLKKALNKFFAEVDCAEGCFFKHPADEGSRAEALLVIESSILYSYLAGEYGWDVHTKFHNAFNGTGYYPEMLYSWCVGFYKD